MRKSNIIKKRKLPKELKERLQKNMNQKSPLDIKVLINPNTLITLDFTL